MADRYSLMWEIRYAMRFGMRQSRALQIVATCLRVLTFTAGTAAFYSVVSDNDELIKSVGLAVAFLSILEAVWDPSGRAAKARELALKFAWLNRDAGSLTDEQLQKEFDSLFDPEAPEWKALRPVAYNDTVEELGNTPAARYELTPWQRIIGRLT